MLKSNFFRPKNFNIFYDFGFEKNPKSSIRAPTKPKKIPLSEKKIFISEVKFRISEVKTPLFWPKKEEKTLC